MDGIFTIEDGTKILAVLQAVVNKIETFGMAYAQPNGRVIVRLRNKDGKGRKTVIDLCSEDKPVTSDEAVRRLFSVADRLSDAGCRRENRSYLPRRQLNPLYVDVIVRQFEPVTGKPATLEDTCETFTTLSEKRREEIERRSQDPSRDN